MVRSTPPADAAAATGRPAALPFAQLNSVIRGERPPADNQGLSGAAQQYEPNTLRG